MSGVVAQPESKLRVANTKKAITMLLIEALSLELRQSGLLMSAIAVLMGLLA
jgi:hypothetical protein